MPLWNALMNPKINYLAEFHTIFAFHFRLWICKWVERDGCSSVSTLRTECKLYSFLKNDHTIQSKLSLPLPPERVFCLGTEEEWQIKKMAPKQADGRSLWLLHYVWKCDVNEECCRNCRTACGEEFAKIGGSLQVRELLCRSCYAKWKESADRMLLTTLVSAWTDKKVQVQFRLQSQGYNITYHWYLIWYVFL